MFNRSFLFLLFLLMVPAARSQEPREPITPAPSDPARGTGTSLSLDEAAARALTRNPVLRIYPWDIRAAEARILQASLPPNPELSLEIEDLRWKAGPEERSRDVLWSPAGAGVEGIVTTGAPEGIEEAEITLRISQLFRLGGKRKKAVAVAARERDVAERDYEIARADVMRDVAAAFIVVLAAQDRLLERRRLLELAETVERAIAARVDAGKSSPIERRRAEVQTAAARIEVERAIRQLDRARITLAATWGSIDPDFDLVIGDIYQAAAVPALDELLIRSEANPDIRRWQYELSRRDASVNLARALRVPDLKASLGFVTQDFEGRDSWGAGFGPDGPVFSRSVTRFDDGRENRLEFEVSIPLPIFDRNQGGLREAEHLRSKSGDERLATIARVKAALSDWRQQAAAAYSEIDMLENIALPAASEAFESVRVGYREGKFGYLEVLDAQRTLFDLRIQLLDAYMNYHLSLVGIERLLGGPLRPGADGYGTSIKEANHE